MFVVRVYSYPRFEEIEAQKTFDTWDEIETWLIANNYNKPPFHITIRFE